MKLSKKIPLNEEFYRKTHRNINSLLKKTQPTSDELKAREFKRSGSKNKEGISQRELADRLENQIEPNNINWYDALKRLIGTKKDQQDIDRWKIIKIAEVLEAWPSEIVTPEIWWNIKVLWDEKEKCNLQRLCKEKGISQETLSNIIGFSLSEVNNQSCPYRVEPQLVVNIAKALGVEPTDIAPPENWKQLPDEFETLIMEITQSFNGRKHVFEEIRQFCREYPKGYFTLVAKPGDGKTAFAAEYAKKHDAICYFNDWTDKSNTENFLRSIRQQLISRYELEDAEEANLPELLKKASKKLFGEPLVIVVDALDEAEQDTENLLDLPKTLPDNVYFLLTRRPYSWKNKKLSLGPKTPEEEMDLDDPKYKKRNSEDIREYIHRELSKLQSWIQAPNPQKQEHIDIDLLATNSENNFLYLVYVLPAFARGEYNNGNELPKGLEQYYIDQWKRMGMDMPENLHKAIVLCFLIYENRLISIRKIAELMFSSDKIRELMSRNGRYEVYRRTVNTVCRDTIDRWRGFLRAEKVEDEESYRIYHKSFRDFLERIEEEQCFVGVSIMHEIRANYGNDELRNIFDIT